MRGLTRKCEDFQRKVIHYLYSIDRENCPYCLHQATLLRMIHLRVTLWRKLTISSKNLRFLAFSCDYAFVLSRASLKTRHYHPLSPILSFHSKRSQTWQSPGSDRFGTFLSMVIQNMQDSVIHSKRPRICQSSMSGGS